MMGLLYILMLVSLHNSRMNFPLSGSLDGVQSPHTISPSYIQHVCKTVMALTIRQSMQSHQRNPYLYIQCGLLIPSFTILTSVPMKYLVDAPSISAPLPAPTRLTIWATLPPLPTAGPSLSLPLSPPCLPLSLSLCPSRRLTRVAA